VSERKACFKSALIDLEAHMECHWCECETDNEMELELNGFGVQVWVVYCDRCQKATDQMGDKAEGASHRERLRRVDTER